MVHLIAGSSTLLVYVDESGDPTCNDPENPVFVLGGFAVLARDLENLVDQPWREVRRTVLGDQSASFHAKTNGRSKLARESMTSYFRASPIKRFAVVVKRTTVFDPGAKASLLDPAVWTAGQALIKRIEPICQAIGPTDVVVLHDGGKLRAGQHPNLYLLPRLANVVVGHQFQAGSNQVPTHWCVMGHVGRADPAQDVADITAYTVARQVRSGHDKNGNWAPLYDAIFCDLGRCGSAFFEIDSVMADAI